MAEDVNVLQADAIQAYENRYSNFGRAVKDNAKRLHDLLPEVMNRVSSCQRSMDHNLQSLTSQLNEARNRTDRPRRGTP